MATKSPTNNEEVISKEVETNGLSGESSFGTIPCCNFCDNNQEVKGWAYESAAQGALIIGAVFLSTALLQLATKAAGCTEEDIECRKKVYGIEPSSLLTLMTTVSGFISALIMPITGAVVDHTNHRRSVAIGTAVAVTSINCIQICVSERTWFFVAILQTINPVLFLTHVTVAMAYLSEMTEDPNKITRYNGIFLAIRSSAMVLSLMITILLSVIIPTLGDIGSLSHTIGTARISQGLMSVVATILFFFTFWRGLKDRPALSCVPEGSSILTTGFKKLICTSDKIYHEYPALKWMIIANILYMSSLAAVPAIAITFTTEFLKMNAIENGIIMFIFLLGAILGSILFPYISKKMDLLQALKLGLAIWIIMVVITTVVISGPEKKNIMYGLVIIWGFLFGWINPNGRVVYLNIMPKGQESEMMGIYVFSANGFVWLPPLIITILNENGISIRIGFLTLAFLNLLAIGALFMMRDFEDAKKTAKLTTNNNETI